MFILSVQDARFSIWNPGFDSRFRYEILVLTRIT
jgi:hypothetical protein